MIDRSAYLERIGHTGTAQPDLATLRSLHKRHMMSIPFDNTDVLAGGLSLNDLNRDVELSFRKIIEDARGGICFELNVPFQLLLDDIGFDTMRLVVEVGNEDGYFNDHFSHVVIAVVMSGNYWLADVGFGRPSFIEPLALRPGIHEQYGCQYEIVQRNRYHEVYRRPHNGPWLPLYRFVLEDVSRSDSIVFGSDDPETLMCQVPVCARATERGQLALLGRQLVTVVNGLESSTVLTKLDYAEAVSAILQG
ncbi:arylamine N-acetyltransferase family protein [Streptomyces monashensis]|uniref:Acetyltransferase n=1 Tax=Streptomyces monashensis TaxID=1678012 RepID=A0A1S2PRW2_9ACTN|nr:arylamine N-acetyltransferase [Streptomyces monashensis]OIJ96322.1 hypothetical protein BIV23_32735 [Streptomyces monashensis]